MAMKASEQPLVTVCIPTYNRPEMLRNSLQSVLWQNYANLEVIISDNASTTDTQAVVDAFGDDRVRVDRLETNIGLHGNLSRCLTLGTGVYRMMLPDDDMLLPGSIASRVEFAETHPQVGLVHTAFRYLNHDSLPYGPVTNWTNAEKDHVQSGPEYIGESIAQGGITCVSSVLLRSDLVSDEQFVADDGPYCDLALWLRVALRSDVGFLTGPFAGYRVHASSASSGFQTMQEVRGRVVLTKHHADALKLAYGRFVRNADLDPELRAEYDRLQKASDKKMRLSIMINRRVPRPLLKLVKKSMGWAKHGRIYNALSLYSAYAPEPVGAGSAPEGHR